MGKLKDQLAGIAALIAAIIAIGGGFVKYGEITTRLDVLTNASKTVDIDYASQIAVIEEKIATLEAGNNGDVDNSLSKLDKRSAINEKQIELLKVQIEEIKVSTSNPLSQ